MHIILILFILFVFILIMFVYFDRLTTTSWDLHSVAGASLSIFVSAFNGQFYSRQVALAYGAMEGKRRQQALDAKADKKAD